MCVRTCENCRHWKHKHDQSEGLGESVGECRCSAPTSRQFIVMNDVKLQFHTWGYTLAIDWCGDFFENPAEGV